MACRETDEGYVLEGTIYSKRGWCKANGGRWDPATKSWTIPKKAARSAAALAEAYKEAEYDPDSKAGYFQRKREDDRRWQARRDAVNAQLDRWKEELRPTATLVEHEKDVWLTGATQYIGYKTGPSFADLQAMPMHNCSRVWIDEYDDGSGVMVYSGGDD